MTDQYKEVTPAPFMDCSKQKVLIGKIVKKETRQGVNGEEKIITVSTPDGLLVRVGVGFAVAVLWDHEIGTEIKIDVDDAKTEKNGRAFWTGKVYVKES
jgi:hypothetical protein